MSLHTCVQEPRLVVWSMTGQGWAALRRVAFASAVGILSWPKAQGRDHQAHSPSALRSPDQLRTRVRYMSALLRPRYWLSAFSALYCLSALSPGSLALAFEAHEVSQGVALSSIYEAGLQDSMLSVALVKGMSFHIGY